MASENLGQILIDAEVVANVGALRELLASGQVKQGERVLEDRNERIDTKDGPITIDLGITISRLARPQRQLVQGKAPGAPDRWPVAGNIEG